VTLGPEPADPLVAGRRGASLCFCGHRDRPSEFEYPLDQESAALHGELRPRMGHKSLLARRLDPDEQGGSQFLNNVLGNYN
jgi:hypothetical protein